jgi:hypothetical protein
VKFGSLRDGGESTAEKNEDMDGFESICDSEAHNQQQQLAAM